MTQYADWQQRVIDEQRDLNEKIIKLTGFLFGGDELRRAFPEDEDLLREQLQHMQAYSAVLCRRIIGFRRPLTRDDPAPHRFVTEPL